MMNSSDNLNVLSNGGGRSSDRRHTPTEEGSTTDITVALKRPAIKRDTLANAGIMTLTGLALASLFGSLLPQELPPQFEGKFQFVVEPLTTQKSLDARKAVTPEWTIDYETQARVLWSPKVVAPIVQRLQATYPDLTTEALLRKLSVTHEPGSDRLSVTYRDFDRQKTQAVLNQLADSYLQFSQECHAGSCRAIQFIDQHLPQLQQQITELNQLLRSFQQFTRNTNPNEFGNYLTQRTQILAQHQNQLQVQMAEVRVHALTLQQRLGLNSQALADELLKNYPYYQPRLDQLRQIASQIFLVSNYPHGNRSSLKELQQQYQQLSAELAKEAGEAALQGAVIQLQNQTSEDSPESQLQTLQEWVGVVHRMRLIEIQQQAIAQSEKQIQTLVQQWAVLARKYTATQLELQTAKSKLELYQQRRAELQTLPNTRLSAHLVAAPETVEVASEDSWLPVAFSLLSGFTISLSLLLLILVLVGAKNRMIDAGQQPNDLQPESVPLNCASKQWRGLTYYRWLFEMLASTPLIPVAKPASAPSFKPIFASVMGAGLAATTVSGLAISQNNHQDTQSVADEPPVKAQTSNQLRFNQVVVPLQWGFRPTAPETMGNGLFSSTKFVQRPSRSRSGPSQSIVFSRSLTLSQQTKPGTNTLATAPALKQQSITNVPLTISMPEVLPISSTPYPYIASFLTEGKFPEE